MAHQLSHSRSRNIAPARVRVGAASSSSNWKPVTAMLAGAAVGGILMYEGHVMSGAIAMAGGLVIGSYLDKESA